MKFVFNLPVNAGGYFRAIASTAGISDETAAEVLARGPGSALYDTALAAMSQAHERLLHTMPAGSC